MGNNSHPDPPLEKITCTLSDSTSAPHDPYKLLKSDFIPLVGLSLYSARTDIDDLHRSLQREIVGGYFLCTYNIALGAGLWYLYNNLLNHFFDQ